MPFSFRKVMDRLNMYDPINFRKELRIQPGCSLSLCGFPASILFRKKMNVMTCKLRNRHYKKIMSN